MKTCLIEFNCEMCGKEKKVWIKEYNMRKHHFCCSKCYWAWKKGRPVEFAIGKHRVKVRCLQCSKEEVVDSWRARKYRFCSRNCFFNHIRDKRIEVFCGNCGKEKYVTPGKFKEGKVYFCGMDCMQKGRSYDKLRVMVYCKQCGKGKLVLPSKVKNLHFCDNNSICYGKWLNTKIEVPCTSCKKIILRRSKAIKKNNFCCKECFNLWNHGENNHV